MSVTAKDVITFKKTSEHQKAEYSAILIVMDEEQHRTQERYLHILYPAGKANASILKIGIFLYINYIIFKFP